MSDVSTGPDLRSLEIPIDSWTQPFWDGAADGKLLVPRCADCGHFRWPPGPFCPRCRSQSIDWTPAGPARLYSFTIIRGRTEKETQESPVHVPALVEFPQAGGIRIPAAIVDTPLSALHIGAELTLGWTQAVNATVPVFSIL